MSHSQTLSLSRNLQSIMKMLFFPRVKRKTNSNHFEKSLKLHCVDVVPLNVEKESEHMEGL